MACDNNDGEVWQSTRKADDLAKCVKTCEDSAKCKSITYYSHGGCDHFSTCCKKKTAKEGAHAQMVKGYGVCLPTTTTTTTNPCATNNGGCSSQRTCQYANGQKSCGPCPKGYHAKGATACEKDTTTTTTTTTTNPCKANNGGCSSQRTCQYANGQKSCGPCPTGYHAKGATACEKDTTTTTTTTTTNPCKANNGGCSSQRTCQYANGQTSCGPCPTGYYASSATACAKDTTPQPNCVFCQREPPIAFMIDRSGSMGWCVKVRPTRNCNAPSRRFDYVVKEVIKMLETMPDGTLFNVQSFSQVTYAFQSNQYVKNSASMRSTLQQWFNANGPYAGTYMTTALTALLKKRSTAKTLYFLADGATSQSMSSLLSTANAGGVPIHVVGVDLQPSDTGYKNLKQLAEATGGSQKYV